MVLAWKFLLPLTLLNLVVVAVWHYTRGWQFPGQTVARWILSAAIIGIPYHWLGMRLSAGRARGPRTYRYAT